MAKQAEPLDPRMLLMTKWPWALHLIGQFLAKMLHQMMTMKKRN
jgi:hypothetical protein